MSVYALHVHAGITVLGPLGGSGRLIVQGAGSVGRGGGLQALEYLREVADCHALLPLFELSTRLICIVGSRAGLPPFNVRPRGAMDGQVRLRAVPHGKRTPARNGRGASHVCLLANPPKEGRTRGGKPRNPQTLCPWFFWSRALEFCSIFHSDRILHRPFGICQLTFLQGRHAGFFIKKLGPCQKSFGPVTYTRQ